MNGSSWATYFETTLTCDPDICGDPNGGGNGECETAFAYSNDYGTCFLDLGFNRWGWTNGPVGVGEYEWDIYAGAGQCNLTKGTLVGTLNVDYDGSTATVTYSTNGAYTMDETHLYVGDEILPMDVNGNYTVAPGQYPSIKEDLGGVDEDIHTVSVSGDVHVVAHAVVCGF